MLAFGAGMVGIIPHHHHHHHPHPSSSIHPHVSPRLLRPLRIADVLRYIHILSVITLHIRHPSYSIPHLLSNLCILIRVLHSHLPSSFPRCAPRVQHRRLRPSPVPSPRTQPRARTHGQLVGRAAAPPLAVKPRSSWPRFWSRQRPRALGRMCAGAAFARRGSSGCPGGSSVASCIYCTSWPPFGTVLYRPFFVTATVLARVGIRYVRWNRGRCRLLLVLFNVRVV